MYLLWVYVSILSVFHACFGEHICKRAFSPGNIVIGGLFPFHLKASRDQETGEVICSDFDFNSVLYYQTMIYAIEEINQARLLPNFTIGYDIYDTCGHIGLAISATLQMMYGVSSGSYHQRYLRPATTQSDIDEPRIKAVIGESSSDVSVTIAKILAVSSIAQISHSASSELLNQKHKFPTFLRTVSSDAHQTDGIVELVIKFNWRAVAIVGSPDPYGKYGSDRLHDLFLDKDICVEFFKILPGDFNQNQSSTHKVLDHLVDRISDSSAEAIILFTKATNVELIMEAAIKFKLNRTWVASDAWSTSTQIATMPGIELAGRVYGFTFYRKEVKGLKNFVTSFSKEKQNDTGKCHTAQYPICRNQTREKRRGHCRLTNSQDGSEQCLDRQCLMNFINQNSSYSLYIAVQVIAQSLRRLMKCDSHQCERTSNFTALELFKEIQKTNLTLCDMQISFDEKGNANLGYEIVYWNQSLSDDDIGYETIGKYWPGGKIQVQKNLVDAMNAVKVSIYNCSKTCDPGQELKLKDKSCCRHCVPCGKGEFSLGNGSKCEHCREDEYSEDGRRDKCHPIKEEFLDWSSPFSIALCCFAAFGSIVTIAFGILFAIYRNTPIVRAIGGNLCFVELLSLQVCFALTFLFIGRPMTTSCRLCMPTFGFASSLCMSCILANMLQILVGFDFNMKTGAWLKKINRPVSVVIVVSGIQFILSVSWMKFKASLPGETELEKKTVYLCHLQSIEFFATTIAYNAFLALICFLFAFKGRQLPDLYKNAVLISISMVLFLIIWLIFVPLFLTLKNKVRPGVESASILIFTYSILCCHFAPKCYIMVFKKELNNEKAITEYIRKHYERQGKPVVTS